MPDNLPHLYELEIAISDRGGDFYPVRATLLEHGPYPPEPHREGNKIIFPAQCVVYEADEVLIPAELLDAEWVPPGLGRALSEIESSAFGAALPDEVILQRMHALAGAIFQQPAHEELLHRFLAHAAPYDPYTGPPAALCRATFIFDDRALARVPWELFFMYLGEDLQRRCVILRRSRAESGEKSGSFDLPLNVAIDTVTDLVIPPMINAWGEDLFDEFVAEARRLGGIEWEELGRGMKSGEVHHIIFDSRDATSLGQLLRKVRGIGQGVRDAGGWSVPPRLLVLHDVSANILPYHYAHLAQSALASGADAVLLAAMNSSDPDSGGFFPTFYRKLMHNWPLDQCLWAAQGVAASKNAPVNYVFGARRGGEFGLLLTRAVLEATQPKATAEAARPVSRRRFGRWRQADNREAFPKIAGPKMAEARAFRVTSEIESSLRRAVEEKKEMVFRAAMESTREISFDEEAHGVSDVIEARKMAGEFMSEAALEISEQEELAAKIVEADPETVQQAMVRLTNLWITENTPENQQRTIGVHDYLISQRPYNLHLQIGPRHEGAVVAAPFNEESLKKVFEKVDEVWLDVMFFATDTDFKLEGDKLEVPQDDEKRYTVQPGSAAGEEIMQVSAHARWGARASLRLPKFGSSDELEIKITPREPGLRRIRTCIYYRNVLLQSVLLEAEVTEEGTEEAAGRVVPQERVITGCATDYVATADFALLNELPPPALNIFTNRDQNGTHWVGVFSSEPANFFQLRSGDMHTFSAETLAARAETMRQVLIEIEGKKKNYKLSAPRPQNDNAPLPFSAEDINRREDYLRALAISGWRLFYELFMSDIEEDNVQRAGDFRDALKRGHIVSIARCGRDSATLPWATLYSNPLIPSKEKEMSLCGIFKQQLADNKWSQDGNTITEKHDLLDDPQACRRQPACPLNGDKKKLTICPFGFWGFLHQIEQPLQQVKPTPVDEVPKELKNYDFSQTSFLVRAVAAPVKIAVGTYPGIPEVVEHGDEIKALNNLSLMDVVYRDERDRIMELLEQGGQHVFYFYCHGDADEKSKVFRLKLGPLAKPGYIEASELLPDEINWQTPKPLIIMNGCETMAVTPDVTYGFLGALKNLGASGIIGTEISVWTQLARPFGRHLLICLLNGMSVGEAFLEARKHLLRQYNPLGLVYSYYSPATLHLHDPAGCAWCDTRMSASA